MGVGYSNTVLIKAAWSQGRKRQINQLDKIEINRGFPDGASSKEPTCQPTQGMYETGLIPGWEDALEDSMATHSSILAWRIPWTEEPGGLQSKGSQRVRHD